MKTIPVICYKLKTPVVYNRGTKWEKQEDTFLACYGYANPEENKRLVNVLNTDDEAKGMFCDKYRLNANDIECFIHKEQEPFDTRGD